MKYLCKLRICILGLLLLTSAIGSTTTAISANAQGQPMPRFALSSIELPNNLAGTYGLIHYGRDFGLDIMKDNFTYLSSHSLATQVVLSGQADIVVGAFVSQMLVRQAGQDFKTFCLRSAKSDQLLLAKGGITKLDQLLDSKVRVSLDSPGGVADATLNAIFQAANINATTKSLSNVHILESACNHLFIIGIYQGDVARIGKCFLECHQTEIIIVNDGVATIRKSLAYSRKKATPGAAEFRDGRILDGGVLAKIFEY